jgi:uncharacterized protein YmfQ (DUF2313 family)
MSVRANIDILRLLFPVELGGEHNADLALDAKHLDTAQASADTLLAEVFPDTTERLLASWERVLGLTPGADDPLQFRREKVMRKIRERGGLSIPYFMTLAQTLGYVVEIVEPLPFMAGWGAAGDELFDATIIYQWGLEIYNQPIYEFRAGESVAGEMLTWWDSRTYLEDLFRELKPAHTFVYFSYIE